MFSCCNGFFTTEISIKDSDSSSINNQANTIQEFDFLEPICSACPKIECLVTEGNFSIPDSVSVCVR